MMALLLVVKATAFLLLTWAVTLMLRRRSAATRHAVWTVGFAMLLALPFASGVLPSWSMPGIRAELEDTPAPPPPPASMPDGAVQAEAQARPNQALVYHTMATEAAEAAPPPSRAGWLWWLWGAGALIAIGWFVSDVARIAAITRRAIPAPARVTLLAEHVARDLGVVGPLDVRSTDGVTVPVAWGLWRPVVILPLSAAFWTAERLRVVLLHELAHVHRRDYASHLLTELACALHWVNPVVWLAARRARAEQERACDDAVLQIGTRSTDYAGHLLDIARSFVREGPATRGALAMARPSTLKTRVRAILSGESDRSPVARRTVLAAVGLALVVGVPVAAAAIGGPPGVEEQIALLISDQMSVRRDAAWRLGALDARSAVPHLIQALADPEAEVRGVAAWALSEIGDSRAVKPLLLLHEDPDPYVREMSLSALRRWGDDARVTDNLLHVLESERVPSVRSVAVWALGEIDGARALRALGDAALNDPDEHTRGMATGGLFESRFDPATVGTQVMRLLGAADADTRALAGHWLAMHPEGIHLQFALRAMADENASVVRYTLMGVGRGAPARLVSAVQVALNHPERLVRNHAVQALGRIGGDAAIEGLLAALRDPEHTVRLLAVQELEKQTAR